MTQKAAALSTTCVRAPRHVCCPPLARLPQRCHAKYEHEARAAWSPEPPWCSTIPLTLRVPRPAPCLRSPRMPLLELGVQDASVPRDDVPTSQAAAHQAEPPAVGQPGRPARSLLGLDLPDSLHISVPGSGRESGDSVALGVRCGGERVLFIARHRRGHLQFQARGSR